MGSERLSWTVFDWECLHLRLLSVSIFDVKQSNKSGIFKSRAHLIEWHPFQFHLQSHCLAHRIDNGGMFNPSKYCKHLVIWIKCFGFSISMKFVSNDSTTVLRCKSTTTIITTKNRHTHKSIQWEHAAGAKLIFQKLLFSFRAYK